MNRGGTLDQVLHAVTAPAEYLAKPYLRAKNHDPENRGVFHVEHGDLKKNPPGANPGGSVLAKPRQHSCLGAGVAGSRCDPLSSSAPARGYAR